MIKLSWTLDQSLKPGDIRSILNSWVRIFGCICLAKRFVFGINQVSKVSSSKKGNFYELEDRFEEKSGPTPGLVNVFPGF